MQTSQVRHAMPRSPATCDYERRGDGWIIVLAGVVDRRFDHGALLDALLRSPGPVTIDCAAVTAVQPEGTWRLAILTAILAEHGREVTYRRCPPAVVARFGRLPRLRYGGRIASVLAPYFCEATGEEALRLLELAELEDLRRPPAFEDEHGRWEFDDVPERFFAFLRR